MVSVRRRFLSQYKIASFSLFVQTTSRLCVCFVVDKFVMKNTGYLFGYLQSNCTLPTILIFILYCTPIPYYTILYYSKLYHTISYHTLPYSTLLYTTKRYYTYTIYYGILILYYTHSIPLFTCFCGDSECLRSKIPERGILQRSSVA